MHRKLHSVLAATIILVPVLGSVGCSDIHDRDQRTTLSDDGKQATRTREQTRTTNDGAVVKEVETQQRTVVKPAPGSSPDASQPDATKSK